MRGADRGSRTEPGTELNTHLQPAHDHYKQPMRKSDTTTLTKTYPGKHGHSRRTCALDNGHETSMEEPH